MKNEKRKKNDVFSIHVCVFYGQEEKCVSISLSIVYINFEG